MTRTVARTKRNASPFHFDQVTIRDTCTTDQHSSQIQCDDQGACLPQILWGRGQTGSSPASQGTGSGCRGDDILIIAYFVHQPYRALESQSDHEH